MNRTLSIIITLSRDLDKSFLYEYQLSFGGLFGRKFSQENKEQKQSNGQQTKTNVYPASKISKIYHKSSIIASSRSAIPVKIIPHRSEVVNTRISSAPSIRINAPAARFEEIEDNTRNWKGLISIDTTLSIKKLENLVNPSTQLRIDHELAELIKKYEKIIRLKN